MDAPVVENGIIIAHAGTGTDSIGRFDIVVNSLLPVTIIKKYGDNDPKEPYEHQLLVRNNDVIDYLQELIKGN